MDFGNTIKILRKNRKISQKELADAVGVSQAMICQIEKNLRVPSLTVGYEIAKALNVAVDELCKGA